MTHARSELSKAVAAPLVTGRDGQRTDWWPVMLCAAALWGVLSWYLSAEWSLSEQYGYGWFVPLLAAGLVWLRWSDRPLPEPPPRLGFAHLARVAGAGIAVVSIPLV